VHNWSDDGAEAHTGFQAFLSLGQGRKDLRAFRLFITGVGESGEVDEREWTGLPQQTGVEPDIHKWVKKGRSRPVHRTLN